MEYLNIGIKLFSTTLLIIIAIYSWMYFSRVREIERQFGLKLPGFVKKGLAFLAMVPMIVSLVVIFVVFIEISFF